MFHVPQGFKSTRQRINELARPEESKVGGCDGTDLAQRVHIINARFVHRNLPVSLTVVSIRTLNGNSHPLHVPACPPPTTFQNMVDPELYLLGPDVMKRAKNFTKLDDAVNCTFKPKVGKKWAEGDTSNQKDDEAKDDDNNFIKRQDAWFRKTRAEVDMRRGKEAYEAGLNRKICPNCVQADGKLVYQAYDEYIEKRDTCSICSSKVWCYSTFTASRSFVPVALGWAMAVGSCFCVEARAPFLPSSEMPSSFTPSPQPPPPARAPKYVNQNSWAKVSKDFFKKAEDFQLTKSLNLKEAEKKHILDKCDPRKVYKTEFNQATGKFIKTPLFATYSSDAEKEFLWQSYTSRTSADIDRRRSDQELWADKRMGSAKLMDPNCTFVPDLKVACLVLSLGSGSECQMIPLIEHRRLYLSGSECQMILLIERTNQKHTSIGFLTRACHNTFRRTCRRTLRLTFRACTNGSHSSHSTTGWRKMSGGVWPRSRCGRCRPRCGVCTSLSFPFLTPSLPRPPRAHIFSKPKQ